MDLTGATVALVILIDLATGQGPPGFNNYMNSHPEFRQSPLVGPVGYMPRGEFDSMKKVVEKEYGNEKLSKIEKASSEYDKHYETKSSTAKPGVIDSFSNSMSDAWSK